MPYVKFTGAYGDFIAGRDVESAVHYEDGSADTCIGIVRLQRDGETEISQAEYEQLKSVILDYNRDHLPVPPDPPVPDAAEHYVAEELRRIAAMNLYMRDTITRGQLERVLGTRLDTRVEIPDVQ